MGKLNKKSRPKLINEREQLLSRVEFLVALVRIAINMYVRCKELSDVSDAVVRLLGSVVVSNLGALVTSDPDTFRHSYCYIEPVSVALIAHKKQLEVIFEWIAKQNTDSVTPRKAIDLKQWLVSLRKLAIITVHLAQ